MKVKLTCLIITFAIFSSCGNDGSENNPDIKINRLESNRQGKIHEETKTENTTSTSLSKGITSKEAKSHVGDSVSVTGYVADIFLSEKVAYLNFENKFPKNTFTCAIFSGKFDEFGDLSIFKNKNVTVNGKIMTYKGKPQMILNSKDQIKINTNE